VSNDPEDVTFNRHRAGLSRASTIAVALLGFITCAEGQQLSNEVYQTNVTVEVAPVAQLEFLDSPLLYLEVPPAGSTLPSNGVDFRVMGTANATLTAEPDDFIEIPGEGFLGKAVLNSGAVGYNIEVRFPRVGVVGSPGQIAGLPQFEAAPTTPLTVDLNLTGNQRDGSIHLLASHEWTVDGGLPLPGIYVGHVTLTLTADY
jgi:hypothetical protein